MSEVRYCPLMREICIKDSCQWWDPEWKDCNMNVMVKYMRAQDIRATFEHNFPAEFLDGKRT